MLFCRLHFFLNQLFRKKKIRTTIRVSNQIVWIQNRTSIFVEFVLGPNCLQSLSADGTRQGANQFIYITFCFFHILLKWYVVHKCVRINCMNLAWSMESGVWNSIPNLGFTSKNDINKHVWYSISSLVFNPNVGFDIRSLVLAGNFQGKLVYLFFLDLKPGFQSQCWF